MVLEWGKKAIAQDNSSAKTKVSKILDFLCSNTPHNRADVFKYNIDVVRFVCYSVFFREQQPIHDIPYVLIRKVSLHSCKCQLSTNSDCLTTVRKWKSFFYHILFGMNSYACLIEGG